MSSSQRRWNSQVATLHRRFTFSSISSGVYLRTISADGTIATHYVISKSKVAPIKQMSIPKLELKAAKLGAELAGFCETEMTIDVKIKKFWTDSRAVSAGSNQRIDRRCTCANRLNKIAENSNKNDWRHVPGKLDPVDHGTRGLAPSDHQKLSITAPSFLIKPESEWTFSGDKTAQTYATQVDDKTSEKPLVDPIRFANWPRLLGTIRTVFRAIRIQEVDRTRRVLRVGQLRGRRKQGSKLSPEDISVHTLQRHSFSTSKWTIPRQEVQTIIIYTLPG